MRVLLSSVSGLLESRCPPDGTERLSSSSSTGYLTRSPFHSIGSETCPWTITADRGQRLNLSIIHHHVTSDSDVPLFSSLSESAHHLSTSSSSSCSTTVVIDDVIAVRRTRFGACAERHQQQQQRRHLVTSAGNALSVHVTGSNGGTDFLLRYSGKKRKFHIFFTFHFMVVSVTKAHNTQAPHKWLHCESLLGAYIPCVRV